MDKESTCDFDKKDFIDFAMLLVNKSKQKELFFSSYETREEIEMYITSYAILE